MTEIVEFAYYHPDGRIEATAQCADVFLLLGQYTHLEHVIVPTELIGEVDDRFYVLDGALTQRPELTLENRSASLSDEVTVDLPKGTLVTAPDGLSETTDHILATSNEPITLTFNIEPPFPYLPTTWEVTFS